MTLRMLGLFSILNIKTPSITTLCKECNYAECHVSLKVMLYAECRYAECRYAECHYAECRYAECHYAECRYAECRFVECRGAALGMSCTHNSMKQNCLT
jgi:hypothetical protein